MKLLGITLTMYVGASLACTSFGVITDYGTIIGKNRDYIYNPQQFVRVMPSIVFNSWVHNQYAHSNAFFAVTSKDDVKMGVNEHGLTAIEEDPPYPNNAIWYQHFKEPRNGYREGLILRGVLQNFNTVAEIKPYIVQIFSKAAPNFYQFADNRQILTVEVAYGDNDSDPVRKFNYKILKQKQDYFTHTNTYLDKNFANLNKLNTNNDAIAGTNNRLATITNLVTSAAKFDINNTANWFLDTKSNISGNKNINWCLNTSIFRSNLQTESSVNLNTGNDKIYGTVSSLIVKNTGIASTTMVYIRLLLSINTLNDGNQLVKYKDATISLSKLFSPQIIHYKDYQFIRTKPQKGICR